ncbi:MAG: hypothetical protein V4560_08100 [Bacteroidota bacterium]
MLIDTDNYDLGRMSMQKKFTQAITIKASALEKLPFSSINEVISVYFNGIYADDKTFVYVVDGNLNRDVNAYSIYDIDELTIIQNAAATLNGLLPNQVLILVKTKKNLAGKSGVSINGQTNMVRLYQTQAGIQDEPGKANGFAGASSTSYYHQYYVSGYVNKKNINMGLSASIQHNVFPAFWNKKLYDVFDAYNTNRFRFNAYADIKMGKYNILSLNGGYVPQRDREYFELLPTFGGGERKKYISQNLWYSNITLKSNILNGLTNKLSAGFQRRQTDGQIVPVDSVSAINSYLAKDELSYRLHLGDFDINAAVNATYRQAKDTATRIFYFGSPAHFIAKQKIMVVTPSLTVNYADMVMLQGGVQKITYTNAPVIAGYDMPKILPFGSASVNVLRPFSVADTDMRLVVFGSFARTMSYASDEYGTLASRTNYTGSSLGNSTFNGVTINPYQTYDQLQGGLTYSVFKNALTLSYNFSIQKFVTRANISGGIPPYTDTSRTTNAHINVHRVGINFVLPTQGNFKWSSYLNGAMFIKKTPSFDNLESEILRLYYPGKNLITGGFVNQFAYKSLFAGVDVIYAYNKELRHLFIPNGSVYYPQSVEKISTLKVQNIYIGYTMSVNMMAIKSLEVYANGRNVFEKGQQVSINKYFAGDSRYFGAGFKLGL